MEGRLFWIDQERHCLQLTDLGAEQTLSESSYPQELQFLQAQLSPDGACIYLLSTDDCYRYDWSQQKLEKLALTIQPLQMSLAPKQPFLFFADAQGHIFSFHLLTGTLYPFGQAQNRCDCVALVAGEQQVYALWEHELGGSLLIFNYAGQVLQEFSFPATPTNLTVRSDGLIGIPFTNHQFTGEGVLFFHEKDPRHTYEIFHLRSVHDPLPCYPQSVAFDASHTKAYVANEDSASLAVIHLKERTIEPLCIGRSISVLFLLKNEPAALAASSRFADLIRIDLTTGSIQPCPLVRAGCTATAFLHWKHSPSS